MALASLRHERERLRLDEADTVDILDLRRRYRNAPRSQVSLVRGGRTFFRNAASGAKPFSSHALKSSALSEVMTLKSVWLTGCVKCGLFGSP